MLPLKPRKWTFRSVSSTVLMSVAPEWKLRRDLRAYDEETHAILSRMRSEKKGKQDIEDTKQERDLFREEYSGPFWERQCECLLSDGRKFGVYVDDVYGDDEEATFERDHFGARWLKDERKFRKALQIAKKEAAKDSRDRWVFYSSLIFGAIGSMTALFGTLNSSKAAIIEVFQDAIKAWKG